MFPVAHSTNAEEQFRIQYIQTSSGRARMNIKCVREVYGSPETRDNTRSDRWRRLLDVLPSSSVPSLSMADIWASVSTNEPRTRAPGDRELWRRDICHSIVELEANLREDFTITEKAATNSPLLKVPTSTFTLKNLLRPYAKLNSFNPQYYSM